jgi:predicted  nucleic acid-binding Zn-ribbon protein
MDALFMTAGSSISHFSSLKNEIEAHRSTLQSLGKAIKKSSHVVTNLQAKKHNLLESYEQTSQSLQDEEKEVRDDIQNLYREKMSLKCRIKMLRGEYKLLNRENAVNIYKALLMTGQRE